MSVRLTAITTPSNNTWSDIVVVAEGSEVAGYSIKDKHIKKCQQLIDYIEEISGITINEVTDAYNDRTIIIQDFLIDQRGTMKDSLKAEMGKGVLQRVFKQAYKLIEGNTSITKRNLGYLRGKDLWKTMKK